MYGCECWTIKKAECQRIDSFELWCWRRLQSPQDCKDIQPVNPKGNQSWIFIGRTDAKAETPILRPPDGKNWLIWKDPDAGNDWKQEGKGTTEDEVIGWHHWLDGHEFEQALEVGDRQGSVACCSPWGCKESDMTEWMNWLTVRVFKFKFYLKLNILISNDVGFFDNLIIQLISIDIKLKYLKIDFKRSLC